LRILFANPAAELGGSERSLLDVLAALGATNTGVDRHLLLFADGELARRARALGVEVGVLPLPADLATLGESGVGAAGVVRSVLAVGAAATRVPASLLELRRRIAAIDPDIVHTNGMKAHVLCRLAVPERPLVVHFRDFAGSRPLSRQLLRAFAAKRVTVVANSEAVAGDLERVVPGLAPRVVYNAIDLAEFAPGPRDLASLAALAGLRPPPPEAVVVGLVATYAFWKGHLTFVDAMARVKAALPKQSLRFYVVGGPIYATRASEITREELRRRIDGCGLGGELGLVPFQANAARVYRGLDIVVHASTRPEPFGRTIIEGMASGRAVVAARAGGATELVAEGETGLFHTPGDAESLARAVTRLAADSELRARLGGAARTSAERRFDRSRLGSELVAIYRELLARF
jgi:glycosyltransferase involved in cell wall biosynthesis